MDHFTFYGKVNQKYQDHLKRKEDASIGLDPILNEIDLAAESGWIKIALTQPQALHLIKMGFYVEHMDHGIFVIRWTEPPKRKSLPPGKPYKRCLWKSAS